MHKRSSLIITGILLCTAIPVSYAETQCTNDGVLRRVAVIYSEPGQSLPCEVRYDKPKQNQSMTLWRAKNEVGFCESQARTFVKRLEDLGWSCNQTPGAEPPSQN